jgi:hypothetical protein
MVIKARKVPSLAVTFYMSVYIGLFLIFGVVKAFQLSAIFDVHCTQTGNVALFK